MAFSLPPATTSFISPPASLFDATGLPIVFNATASGLTWNYKFQTQSTWTAITIVAGTQGTWASGSIVNSGTTSALQGDYELGIPNAAIPQSFGQTVKHILQGGTTSTQTMAKYPFTLVGSNVNSTGGVTVGIDNATSTRNANIVTFNGSNGTYTQSGTNYYLNVLTAIDSGTSVRNANVVQINNSANAAAALSFAANDTNNALIVDAQFVRWSGIYNGTANTFLNNTTIGGVSTLPTINDTNSSAALVILQNATQGTASFAPNWALVTNATANISLSGTSIKTDQTFTAVNNVVNPVGITSLSITAIGFSVKTAVWSDNYTTSDFLTATSIGYLLTHATTPIYGTNNLIANATTPIYSTYNNSTQQLADLDVLVNSTGNYSGPSVADIVAGLTTSTLLTTSNIYGAETWLYFQDMTEMNGTTPAWKFESLINIMGSNSSATNTAILAAAGGGGTGSSFTIQVGTTSISVVPSSSSGSGGVTLG